MVTTPLFRLFSTQNDNLISQLFRYAFVGGLAFIADFGLLYLLTSQCGLYYQLSACISFIAGLTINYFFSIAWVFNKNRDRTNNVAEFLMFAMVGIFGLGLNALIMYILTDLIGMQYMVSKIFSTIVVFGWNFIGRRYISNNRILCKN